VSTPPAGATPAGGRAISSSATDGLPAGGAAAGGSAVGAGGSGPVGRGALVAAERPLAESYDVALLDLDGVVYLGQTAIPSAPPALAATRERGMRLAFVTNNALRTPAMVADLLTSLGVPAEPADVITSSQAACRALAERLGRGAKVLVTGGEGLRYAGTEAGLTLVDSADDDPAGVVQGYSPDIGWRQLAETALAVQAGALWIATNLDATVPSPRGPLPGNGSLVAAVRHATGVTPRSTGKPDPAMHRESLLRSGAAHPIVVGDRLDTDIEGADRVGCASLLVLTGVSTAAALLAAPPHQRPTYVAADLSGLLTPHPAATDLSCGGWQASPGDPLTLAGSGDDPIDALRALCVAAWSEPREDGAPKVRADGPAAEAALSTLRLAPGQVIDS
jgi:glycerol-1-phosphatase